MDREQFGRKITLLRSKNGLSLELLAQLCNIPIDTLEGIENGTDDISETQLEAIAEFLNVNPLVLLGMDYISDETVFQTRLRTQGVSDPEIRKALEFAQIFVEQIDELKQLSKLD